MPKIVKANRAAIEELLKDPDVKNALSEIATPGSIKTLSEEAINKVLILRGALIGEENELLTPDEKEWLLEEKISGNNFGGWFSSSPLHMVLTTKFAADRRFRDVEVQPLTTPIEGVVIEESPVDPARRGTGSPAMPAGGGNTSSLPLSKDVASSPASAATASALLASPSGTGGRSSPPPPPPRSAAASPAAGRTLGRGDTTRDPAASASGAAAGAVGKPPSPSSRSTATLASGAVADVASSPSSAVTESALLASSSGTGGRSSPPPPPPRSAAASPAAGRPLGRGDTTRDPAASASGAAAGALGKPPSPSSRSTATLASGAVADVASSPSSAVTESALPASRPRRIPTAPVSAAEAVTSRPGVASPTVAGQPVRLVGDSPMLTPVAAAAHPSASVPRPAAAGRAVPAAAPATGSIVGKIQAVASSDAALVTRVPDVGLRAVVAVSPDASAAPSVATAAGDFLFEPSPRMLTTKRGVTIADPASRTASVSGAALPTRGSGSPMTATVADGSPEAYAASDAGRSALRASSSDVAAESLPSAGFRLAEGVNPQQLIDACKNELAIILGEKGQTPGVYDEDETFAPTRSLTPAQQEKVATLARVLDSLPEDAGKRAIMNQGILGSGVGGAISRFAPWVQTSLGDTIVEFRSQYPRATVEAVPAELRAMVTAEKKPLRSALKKSVEKGRQTPGRGISFDAEAMAISEAHEAKKKHAAKPALVDSTVLTDEGKIDLAERAMDEETIKAITTNLGITRDAAVAAIDEERESDEPALRRELDAAKVRRQATYAEAERKDVAAAANERLIRERRGVSLSSSAVAAAASQSEELRLAGGVELRELVDRCKPVIGKYLAKRESLTKEEEQQLIILADVVRKYPNNEEKTRILGEGQRGANLAGVLSPIGHTPLRDVVQNFNRDNGIPREIPDSLSDLLITGPKRSVKFEVKAEKMADLIASCQSAIDDIISDNTFVAPPGGAVTEEEMKLRGLGSKDQRKMACLAAAVEALPETEREKVLDTVQGSGWVRRGMPLREVIDHFRKDYPHATVEAVPAELRAMVLAESVRLAPAADARSAAAPGRIVGGMRAVAGPLAGLGSGVPPLSPGPETREGLAAPAYVAAVTSATRVPTGIGMRAVSSAASAALSPVPKLTDTIAYVPASRSAGSLTTAARRSRDAATSVVPIGGRVAGMRAAISSSTATTPTFRAAASGADAGLGDMAHTSLATRGVLLPSRVAAGHVASGFAVDPTAALSHTHDSVSLASGSAGASQSSRDTGSRSGSTASSAVTADSATKASIVDATLADELESIRIEWRGIRQENVQAICRYVNQVIPFMGARAEVNLRSATEVDRAICVNFIYQEVLTDSPRIERILEAARLGGLLNVEIGGIKISALTPANIKQVQKAVERKIDAIEEELESARNVAMRDVYKFRQAQAATAISHDTSPLAVSGDSRSDAMSSVTDPTPPSPAARGATVKGVATRYGKQSAARGTAVAMVSAAIDPAFATKLEEVAGSRKDRVESELMLAIAGRQKLNHIQYMAVRVIMRELTEENPDLDVIHYIRTQAHLPGEMKFGGVRLDQLNRGNINKAADAVSRELVNREVTAAWGRGFERSFSPEVQDLVNNPSLVTVGPGTWLSPGDATTRVILGLAVDELRRGDEERPRGLRYYQALGAHRSLNAGSKIRGKDLTSALNQDALDAMKSAVNPGGAVVARGISMVAGGAVTGRAVGVAGVSDDASTVRGAGSLSTPRPTRFARAVDGVAGGAAGTGSDTMSARTGSVIGGSEASASLSGAGSVGGGAAHRTTTAGKASRTSPAVASGTRFARAVDGWSSGAVGTGSDTMSARTGSVIGGSEASASLSGASSVGGGAAHRTTTAGTKAPRTSPAVASGMRGRRGGVVGDRLASRSFDEESIHSATSEGMETAIGAGHAATAVEGRRVRGPGLTTHVSARAVSGSAVSAAGVTAAMGAHYSQVFEKMFEYYLKIDTTTASEKTKHPFTDELTPGEIAKTKVTKKEKYKQVLHAYLSSPRDPDDARYGKDAIGKEFQSLIRRRREEMNGITRKLVSHESPELEVGKNSEIIDFGGGCHVEAKIDTSSGKRVITSLTPTLAAKPAAGEIPEPITITLPRKMADGKNSNEHFDVVEFAWDEKAGKYKASKMSVLGGPNVGESQISLDEQLRLAKEVEAAKGGRDLGKEIPTTGMTAIRRSRSLDPGAALAARVISPGASAYGGAPPPPLTRSKRRDSAPPGFGGH